MLNRYISQLLHVTLDMQVYTEDKNVKFNKNKKFSLSIQPWTLQC